MARTKLKIACLRASMGSGARQGTNQFMGKCRWATLDTLTILGLMLPSLAEAFSSGSRSLVNRKWPKWFVPN